MDNWKSLYNVLVQAFGEDEINKRLPKEQNPTTEFLNWAHGQIVYYIQYNNAAWNQEKIKRGMLFVIDTNPKLPG